MDEEIEAVKYYVDDILEQMTLLKDRNPTKADMFGYISDWKENLNVVKSLLS